jgi:hypothetical protein
MIGIGTVGKISRGVVPNQFNQVKEIKVKEIKVKEIKDHLQEIHHHLQAVHQDLRNDGSGF